MSTFEYISEQIRVVRFVWLRRLSHRKLIFKAFAKRLTQIQDGGGGVETGRPISERKTTPLFLFQPLLPLHRFESCRILSTLDVSMVGNILQINLSFPLCTWGGGLSSSSTGFAATWSRVYVAEESSRAAAVVAAAAVEVLEMFTNPPVWQENLSYVLLWCVCVCEAGNWRSVAHRYHRLRC